MSVKAISTLGCNPLLMLHKMADLEGLEVISSEEVVRGGITHYYRMVVRLPSGLYMEAYDPVNEMLLPSEDRRLVEYISTSLVGSSTWPYPSTTRALKQELLETDWNALHASWGGGDSTGTGLTGCGISLPDMPGYQTRTSPNIDIPFASFSCYMNWYELNEPGKWLSSSYGGVPIGGGAFCVGGGDAGNGDINSTTMNIGTSGETRRVGFCLPPMPLSLNAPFASNLQTGSPTVMFLGGTINETKASWVTTKRVSTRIRMFSGAMLRIGLSLSVEGELQSPSEWVEFSVHHKIVSTDAGLFIMNESPNKNHNVFYCQYVGMMDTTKGNGFGGGSCPVIARFHRLGGGPNASISPLARVVGESVPGFGMVNMSHCTPTVPIISDLVSGGPVVANTFLFSDSEIRGVYVDILSCSEILPVGSSGWLDGKRYAVVAPGRMQRVG